MHIIFNRHGTLIKLNYILGHKANLIEGKKKRKEEGKKRKEGLGRISYFRDKVICDQRGNVIFSRSHRIWEGADLVALGPTSLVLTRIDTFQFSLSSLSELEKASLEVMCPPKFLYMLGRGGW